MLPNSSQNLPDDSQRRYKCGMLCACRTRIEIRTVGDLESLAISLCAFSSVATLPPLGALAPSDCCFRSIGGAKLEQYFGHVMLDRFSWRSRRRAICLFESPSATNSITSVSRPVSEAGLSRRPCSTLARMVGEMYLEPPTTVRMAPARPRDPIPLTTYAAAPRRRVAIRVSTSSEAVSIRTFVWGFAPRFRKSHRYLLRAWIHRAEGRQAHGTPPARQRHRRLPFSDNDEILDFGQTAAHPFSKKRVVVPNRYLNGCQAALSVSSG